MDVRFAQTAGKNFRQEVDGQRFRPWFDARDRLDERSSSNSAIHLARNHAPDHLAAATTRLSNIHSPRDSGASLARLAVGDDVNQVSGKYYEGQRPIPSSKDSQVVEKQEDLWEWTVERVAKDDQERRDFENV